MPPSPRKASSAHFLGLGPQAQAPISSSAPFLTAILGLFVERLLIRRLYGGDPLYSLLLTFGLAYVLEDVARAIWGAQSLPFPIPSRLTTPLSSEFFFLTGYRIFMVILVGPAIARLVAKRTPDIRD